jgi:uncharacterized protein YbjT (DUF2867 family)
MPVRAIVRDEAKAADWAARGVEIIQGDLGNSASVESAMDGCDQAVLILPNSLEQEAMELAYVASAVKSGIKHFIKLSSPEAEKGTKSPIPLVHIAAEDAIRASGLNYTLVRPHFFMQNLINYGAAAKETGQISLPMGTGNVSPTDCNDAGEFIAEVIAGGEKHYGQSYDISGPELMDFNQVAAVFGDVLGKEVEYVDADPKVYQERMRQFLTSDLHSDAVAILFREIADKATPGYVTDTFERIVGRPPTSFKEFLQANL